MRYRIAIILLMLCASAAAKPVQTELGSIDYQIVSSGLEHPWSLAFLPDGRFLVSERPGRLRVIEADGRLNPQPVGGLPAIKASGQGGLLDVVLHPDFEQNRWVYFSYTEAGPSGMGTAVARGRLRGMRLHETEVLFRLMPKSSTGRHFGSRLVFDRRGYLFITLGDRGDRPRAQALDDHIGTLIRLHDDGRVPADNPFVFYEGPPTANGKPGIHHVLARSFKDAFPRYKTMRGFLVERKAGWDTHGLPVEVEVEKELGISGREAIEEYIRKNDISVNIHLEISSNHAIKRAVEDGLGIALISRRVAIDEIHAGRLAAIPLSDPSMIRKYYMVHHKDKYLSEPLQSFIGGVFEWAAAYLRELR